MLKTAEKTADLQSQLEKSNGRFTALVACVVAAFAFTKEQESALTKEDFSAINVGVEELQKPAKAYRSVLATKLELTDEQLNSPDAFDSIANAISAKDTKISELGTQLTEANGKVTKLESEKKTVDEAADLKAREIAARSGGNLPAKQPGAGNKIQEGAETGGLKGMAKVRAYFASRQPQPATAAA